MIITDTTRATARMLCWIMEFKRDIQDSPEKWEIWGRIKVNEAISIKLFIEMPDSLITVIAQHLVLFCLGKKSQFDKLMEAKP